MACGEDIYLTSGNWGDNGRKHLNIILRSPHDQRDYREDNFNHCLTYQAAACKRSYHDWLQYSAYGVMAYTGCSTEIFEREDGVSDWLPCCHVTMQDRPWNPTVFPPDYCFLLTLN